MGLREDRGDDSVLPGHPAAWGNGAGRQGFVE